MRAKIDILEETGLEEKNIKLVKEGDPLKIIDNEKKILWNVHPFLWDVSTDKVKIDWEHKTIKWILPEEIGNYQTVPKLKEVLDCVI